MSIVHRKKSPRAPSIALDVAIERVLRVYDKEGCHPTALDVVAQDLGYKGANNGAFLTTIASLRYYGLLERPKDGYLAVSKELESFKFAPSEDHRHELQIKWLKKPVIFSELLQKYDSRLPSDAALKHDLIQRGFNPKAADDCLAAFRKSVDVTHYFDSISSKAEIEESGDDIFEAQGEIIKERDSEISDRGGAVGVVVAKPDDDKSPTGMDRIPVRLAGGRRAWLEIPVPFYEADKKRLVAQIELILTDDEDVSDLI